MLSFVYNLGKCISIQAIVGYSFNEAIAIQAIVCL